MPRQTGGQHVEGPDNRNPTARSVLDMSNMKKVCVVGTGHIGLPLAAVLAEAGFQVTGYDTNDDFVSHVNTAGVADFREDGLDELLAKHLHKGLMLTSTPPAGQDVYIITVGTPLRSEERRVGKE